MKVLIFTFISFISLLLSPALSAQVNLIEGSYRHTETDFISPPASSRIRAFELLRSYSSRSNEVGLLGHGWCSNLETKLFKRSANSVEIQYCPLQSKIKFRLNPRQRPIQRFISMLNDKTPAPSEQNVYSSEGSHDGQLTQSPQGWNWSKPDGGWVIFFSDGRIKEENLSDGRFIQYIYDTDKKLNGIILDKRLHLKIDYAPKSNLISSIGDTINMTYAGRNLVKVDSAGSSQLLYSYDEFDNLRRIQKQGLTSVLLAYDAKDRIENVVADGCNSRYAYPSPQPTSSLAQNLRIQQNKSCSSGQSLVKIYEFSFAQSPSGDKILKQAEIKENDKLRRIHFHPQWGHPTLIEENGEKIYFTYDSQGKLLQRKLASVGSQSVFDSQGRLIQLSLPQGENLFLTYAGQEAYPHTISSPEHGHLQLRWKNGAVSINNAVETEQSRHLKTLLEKALKSLERIPRNE